MKFVKIKDYIINIESVDVFRKLKGNILIGFTNHTETEVEFDCPVICQLEFDSLSKELLNEKK